MHILGCCQRQRMPAALAQARLEHLQSLNQQQIRLAPMPRLADTPQELRRQMLLPRNPQTGNRQMLLRLTEGLSEKGAVTPDPKFARCNAVYSGNHATSPIVSRNSRCCSPVMSEFSYTSART